MNTLLLSGPRGTAIRHTASARRSVVRLLPGDGVGGTPVDVGLEVDHQTQPGHGLAGSLLSSVDGRRDLVPIVLSPHRKLGADEQLLGSQVKRAQVDDALDGAKLAVGRQDYGHEI